MRVLILGAGYVAQPLTVALSASGHEFLAVNRTQGVDITKPDDLKKLSRDWDCVINTVSSSKGDADTYRRVFLEGTRNVIDWLSDLKIQKYVYTSSTSVYGQTDGSIVDESSSTEPATETGRILIETEQLVRGFRGIILRLAGIYGPERGHLFRQYIAGKAVMTGDGSRYINMIHRDDVARAIVAALERAKPGEIYNVADDEPVTELQFFQCLSKTLNRPMPPFAAEPPSRKRGSTNKRVSNRKLREELRFELQYPNFRIGYACEIRRLGLKPAEDCRTPGR